MGIFHHWSLGVVPIVSAIKTGERGTWMGGALVAVIVLASFDMNDRRGCSELVHVLGTKVTLALGYGQSRVV